MTLSRMICCENCFKLGLILLIISLLLSCSEAPSTEKLIFTMPKNAVESVKVSEDGTHWCYQTKTEKGIKVEGDRNYSPSEYNNIGYVAFASQTGRCGFWAVKGGTVGGSIILVVDGTEYVTKAQADGFFNWSINGKHWIAVWSEKTDEKNKTDVIMFDGKEIGRYEDVKAPVFSNDSEHFGFLIIDGNTIKVNIDGKEKEMGYSKQIFSGWFHASPLSFLKNGQLAAIVPKTGTQRYSWGDSWAVIKGDNIISTYPTSLILVRQGSTSIQLSGEEQGDENLPTVAPLSLTVNEEGTVLAWWARTGGKGMEWHCYVDGKPVGSGRAYPPIEGDDICLSPNGKRVAWRVSNYEGDKLKSASIVLDGKIDQPYRWLGGITFSPSSSRYAYWAKKMGGKGYIYIVDEKEIGMEFEDVTEFIFSPDSKHFAYIGKRRKDNYMILDGKEYKMLYDSIWGLRLLAKGRPVLFGQSGSKIFLIEGIPTIKKS